MTGKISDTYILVTASVSEEAEGIKDGLNISEILVVGGRTVYAGVIDNVAVHLMVTGPGMVNTAQSITAAIENRRPGGILMTGCAGGFADAGIQVGDIAVATSETDAHLGIESENNDAALQELPFFLGQYDGEAVKHNVRMDNELSSRTHKILGAHFRKLPVGIMRGPFITVSTITATDSGADRLFKNFRPCMENMEGFAAAYIARHYGIPFTEIRSASNLVGKRNLSDWDLPLACERSAEAALVWVRGEGTRNKTS